MAADCKSAAPWSYGGSNPPLCTINLGPLGWKLDEARPVRVETGVGSPGRKWIALALLVVLSALAVKTIDPGRVRSVVLLLLGFFAARIALAAYASR
jgi:hypothetical protein